MSRTSSNDKKKSNAERKRGSRARKPPSYHDGEREASRKRMAIYRAKIKAEKRARHLKSLLREEDRAAVDARGAGLRRRLLQDWFDKTDTKLDPTALGDEKALRSHITKVDLHKIERQVAEFEVSIMEDDCGEPVKESAKADATDSEAFIGSTGQEVGQWEPLNINIVKKVTEEGFKIGLADLHSQACGSTEQAVHKYQLTQDQSALSNHEADRLAKKDQEVFEDGPESKPGPAHPQMFFESILEQFGAYPPAPARRELDRLVEGDAKPSGAEGQWESSNFKSVKEVNEEGPKIGLADPHTQACGSTQQAVHKYQLMQDQTVLSRHEVDRLAKRDEKVFEDIPESKAGRAHPQMFVDSILEQFGAYPPSRRELDRLRRGLDRLVEGDAKPSGAEACKMPSRHACVRGSDALDAGQGGGSVDELLAARRDDALPPMDAGRFDADGGGAESFRPDSYSW